MSNKTTSSNTTPKGTGASGGALAIVSLAINVIGMAKPVIEIVDNKLKERADERKDWVTIPELCSRTIPMKLDCALDALEKINVKVGYSAVELKNAKSKYKDCFDSQIVWADHKRKQKVKPGTLVLLKYVTSEIIEEGQRLFDESEKHKAETKCEKANKANEQKQKARKIVASTVDTALKRRTKPIEAVGEHEMENTHE